jgi:hypothetical protein
VPAFAVLVLLESFSRFLPNRFLPHRFFPRLCRLVLDCFLLRLHLLPHLRMSPHLRMFCGLHMFPRLRIIPRLRMLPGLRMFPRLFLYLRRFLRLRLSSLHLGAIREMATLLSKGRAVQYLELTCR